MYERALGQDEARLRELAQPKVLALRSVLSIYHGAQALPLLIVVTDTHVNVLACRTLAHAHTHTYTRKRHTHTQHTLSDILISLSLYIYISPSPSLSLSSSRRYSRGVARVCLPFSILPTKQITAGCLLQCRNPCIHVLRVLSTICASPSVI